MSRVLVVHFRSSDTFKVCKLCPPKHVCLAIIWSCIKLCARENIVQFNSSSPMLAVSFRSIYESLVTLLVTLYWSLSTGHSLLVTLYWSLSTGHSLLVTLYWPLFTGHSLLVTLYWSLYCSLSTGHSLLLTLYWSLYCSLSTGHSLLVTHYWSLSARCQLMSGEVKDPQKG